MTEENHVRPRYREGLKQVQEPPVVDGAVSATQEQLAAMEPHARWVLEATERTYRAGGNEGDNG